MALEDLWSALTRYRCRLWLTGEKLFGDRNHPYAIELPSKGISRTGLGARRKQLRTWEVYSASEVLDEIEKSRGRPGSIRLIAPFSPLEASFGAGLSVDQSGRKRLPKGLPDERDIDPWIAYRAFSRNQLSDAALKAVEPFLEQQEWDEGLERTRSMPLKRPNPELDSLPGDGPEALAGLAEFLKQVYSVAVIQKKPSGDEWYCHIAFSISADEHYLQTYPDHQELFDYSRHPKTGERLSNHWGQKIQWFVNGRVIYSPYRLVESEPSSSPGRAVGDALEKIQFEVKSNGIKFNYQDWPPIKWVRTVSELRRVHRQFGEYPPDYKSELIWPETDSWSG